MSARELSMAEAINEAIRHEMRRDDQIVLLGQDIGSYGGTFGVYKGLFDEFGPDRSATAHCAKQRQPDSASALH